MLEQDHGTTLRILARFLGLELSALALNQELRRDLRLAPLDLVLFCLELEHGYDLPFPFEALEHTHTVFELLELVSVWHEAALPPARGRRWDSALAHHGAN